MSSEGKVAIITGGGTGIGKASALTLAADGYSVTISGRRAEPLEETIADAGEAGSRILGVQCDVGDPDSVKNMFAKSQERFGRLDVVFSNAGTGAPRGVAFEDLTYDQWMTVVNANFTGTFLCAQEAIKIMKNQAPMGGRIINNGSLSAYVP
ncbi:MAG TPA: 3-oxoacyl-ACP reductase, partial [Dehalococcoidia bacterium]|nr:3-oxoacyl-ACP reductase [Dehalococcoidia bacterium]